MHVSPADRAVPEVLHGARREVHGGGAVSQHLREPVGVDRCGAGLRRVVGPRVLQAPLGTLLAKTFEKHLHNGQNITALMGFY